jgi:hypothetical protein
MINTGGIAISIYTPPDNGGDTSGIWIDQTGGGNGISVYNLCGNVPVGYTAYCGNGYAIEAGTDGTKNTIISRTNAGAAYIAYVGSASANSGMLIYPATDTGFANVRALHVENAAESVENAFITFGGEVYAGQELNSPQYILTGAVSKAAWGSTGLQFQGNAATLTDTSSSGVVATNFDYVMTAPTLAASSPTTYNDADTVVITGPPVAGTNVTIGTARALKVASGTTLLQGGAIITGGTVNLDPSNFNVLISPTGTGTVTINPATAGTMNNMAIGGTTPAAVAATTVTATATIKTGGYTVATLPAGTVGARAYVTDATSCTLNGTLTGSGSTFCPVIYNGTAWVGG